MLLDLSEKLKDKRYIIVGDIHGCFEEFKELLDSVKFNYDTDYLISVGDLIDRGPDSLSIYKMFLKNKERWFAVCGNHDDRFKRYLQGRRVQLTHGLEQTVSQFAEVLDNPADKKICLDYFSNLPYIIKLPKNAYVLHAGVNPTKSPENQGREDCIFMRYFGGKDYFDAEGGKYWFTYLSDLYPTTFTGHEVHDKLFGRGNYDFAYRVNFTKNIDYLLDGGCVFGGTLRAWDSESGVIHQVKAKVQYSKHLEDMKAKLDRSKKHFEENKLDKAENT